MRKIKFRVWNGYEMEYEKAIGLISSASINEFFERDDITMQLARTFNNVEYYEGDIVTSNSYKDKKWVITWVDDSEYCGFVPKEIGKDSPSYFVSWGDMKIIGNIYENPDLLSNK